MESICTKPPIKGALDAVGVAISNTFSGGGQDYFGSLPNRDLNDNGSHLSCQALFTPASPPVAVSSDFGGFEVGSPGLVYSKQHARESDSEDEVFTWDPEELRQKRLEKAVRLASQQHDLEALGWKPAFITLTYRNIEDWKPSDIGNYLNTGRKYCRRNGFVFRYVWVAELQKRGAVHYHVVAWLPPSGNKKGKFIKLPKPDVCGWWPHGSSQIQWARNPVAYISKYASKGHDASLRGKFPKGLRLHGSGGLSLKGKAVVRFEKRPEWFKKFATPSEKWDAKKGGGYQRRGDGVVVLSPNAVKFCAGRLIVGSRSAMAHLEANGSFMSAGERWKKDRARARLEKLADDTNAIALKFFGDPDFKWASERQRDWFIRSCDLLVQQGIPLEYQRQLIDMMALPPRTVH